MQLSGSSRHAADLDFHAENENSFRQLLGTRSLRAYHATRLLDHEVELIREQGLIPLDHVLIERRVELASKRGFITEQERAQLHEGHVFREPPQGRRAGQVCMFVGEQLFDDTAGLGSLLGIWGGEGVYMASGTQSLVPRLRQLGRPTIVVANIQVAEWESSPIHPDLWKVFVGHHLRLSGIGADLFLRYAVPPEWIADIWQPGHPGYDRWSLLPRS